MKAYLQPDKDMSSYPADSIISRQSCQYIVGMAGFYSNEIALGFFIFYRRGWVGLLGALI